MKVAVAVFAQGRPEVAPSSRQQQQASVASVARPRRRTSQRNPHPRRPAVAVFASEGKDDGETLGNLDAILGGNEDPLAGPEEPSEEPSEEDGFFERKAMSEAQKKKLRDEYLAFGGSANTAMGANYYLYIIVIISALAVAAKLSGAI
ncbi:hypothetical protein HOP50_01g04450 [Chloropicon primus]|uniref:Uncharacterized protein n=2 Tax=Chloropicon primus TaxID=1764295 RepID=A0A5B8MC73_9CHLO|nr:hypothetical protein A3770_01p04570 [Chloropicon primus]UPQ97154.1 hypothetical protein HOP50_01g04450 [Chloropicon primus]|eukprot:QDZ17939.1 hypothetical protein A3770_01p04570 [Chloropicon primus]